MYILLALQWAWDLSKFDSNDTTTMFVLSFRGLVNFGKVFALFLSAFTVEFELSLFIVSVIKCYIMAYLCGTPSSR